MTLALDSSANADRTAPLLAASAAESEELVRAHLPLVGHLVREVINRVPAHVSRDDLVSAGMLALTLSARSFNVSYGVPFARFATIRIRGALTDELRTMDWASRAVRGKARELDAVRAQLTHAVGREPTRRELASALGLSAAELAAVEADVHRAGLVSLQALAPDAGAETLQSGEDGPEAVVLRREQIGYLRDAIAQLPEKLRRVVNDYFFGHRKMVDIAADLGVTESRVSQLRSEALRRLRAELQRHEAGSLPPRQATSRTRDAALAAGSGLAGQLAAMTTLSEARTRRAAAPDRGHPHLRIAQ